MGLFSFLKKKNKKEQHAFVFICRGPDPTGLSNILEGIGGAGDFYSAMVHYGYEGKESNVHVLSPNWNDTRYSSWKPTPDEVEDLLPKVKKELQKRGFTYAGENVSTARFNQETTFGQMGFFMTYLFIEK